MSEENVDLTRLAYAPDEEYDPHKPLDVKVEMQSLYEQPFDLLVNQHGHIAVSCRPCTEQLNREISAGVYGRPEIYCAGPDGRPDNILRYQLMSPVEIGPENACRCERCGALGPMVSYVDTHECRDGFGPDSNIIDGQDPETAPDWVYKEGSVYVGHQ